MVSAEESHDQTSVKNHGLMRQIIVSLIVSIPACQAGMFGGWLSPMSLKLMKDDSPVETMTKDEIAFMGSLPTYAGLIIAFFTAYVATTFGRKPPLYISGILSCVGAVAITFAPTKMYLYVGRTIGCIIMSCISAVYMYISETVHESIRGTMMSMSSMLLNGGILISYILGSILSYKAYNSIFIVSSITYTVLMFWLPETPYFLVEKSRIDEARKSLLRLREGDHSLVELELNRIVAASGNREESVGLCQVLKTKSTRLALIISASAFGFQSLGGIQAILNYAGVIFKEAGSLMSPETCSIIIGAILTVACVVSVILIDKLGRKPLLYISFIGGAISLLALSVFLYVKMEGTNVDKLGWIPVGSLSIFVLVYGIGVGTVPGAISNELSPTSIRPIVNAAIIIVVSPLVSVVIQSFPFLDDNFGLYSVFTIPVVINILATIFTLFMVPETKGKSFAEIESELNNW